MANLFANGVDPLTVLFALLGGVLPAVFWLLFWLREDAKHPEPRSLIITSFFAGAIAVFIALPIEKSIVGIFGIGTISTLILWALTEELVKFGAAATVGLRSKAYDEPVDAMIYLMTAALGFAALENTLFVLKDLLENGSAIGMLTTSMRTVGATLLHVAASALIGGSLALVFYKSKVSRFFMLIVGIILATALHTLFNQLIIATKGEGTLYVFGGLWILIVGIILLFEYIKNRKQPSRII